MYWLDLEVAKQHQKDLHREAEIERLVTELRKDRPSQSIWDLLRDARLGLNQDQRQLLRQRLADMNSPQEAPCTDPC